MDGRLEELILGALAEVGIEDHYWDLWGNRHDTKAGVAAAVLSAQGYDTSSAEPLEHSLESRRRARAQRIVPETVVLRQQGGTLQLPIADPDGLWFEVRTEQGATHSWESSAQLPELPLGYHRLLVGTGTRTETAHLVLCPPRAHLPNGKHAGLGIFLPGLRDANTWGCGDFRALGRLAVWAAQELRASYVALNPLQAIHNRWPYNTSPYLPNSLLYRNFIYLDIPSLVDFSESMEARRLFASIETHFEIVRLQVIEQVDYDGVARLKRRFLEQLFGSFWQKHWQVGTARSGEFAAYLESEGEPLRKYGLHCALDEHFHSLNPDVWNWPGWPVAYQSPDTPECTAFAAAHERECLFHCWVQWQIDKQLAQVQADAKAAGMAIGLFHDLPLATDRFGAELWGHRELYLASGSVGAPPDALGPQGQDWGFPPPNRDAHRASGYQHFAHTIRASARHGGALRMDHVMRLFRLFSIPEDFRAADGIYVKDYAEDLLGVLALESVRNGIVIIGEDLGTVSDGVRETLAANAVLSYRLLYFERSAETTFKRPSEYPAQALVSTTTHDLPTIAGYWQGRDINLRRECGLVTDGAAYERELRERHASKQGILDGLFAEGLLPESFSRDAAHYPELTGELHNAIIGFLASTPSMLLTVNQEDLTKETEQQNLPGTVHEYPNWRRKMRMALEELMAEPNYTTMLRNWLERTGRSISPA